MSNSKAQIMVTLGGVERTLSLKIGDIEDIEDILGTGIASLCVRLKSDYRIKDIRTILQVALNRSGWKPSPINEGGESREPRPREIREQVSQMILVEGPAAHVTTAAQLIEIALTPLPGGN